jgi:hypothetical protein
VQRYTTGWMHQTERMIAATFLVDYCGRAVQVESSLTHSLKAPGFNP